MTKVGVVHGRFQPLHRGHMEYISAAKARCDHLIVGIANPDPSLTVFNKANPQRSQPESNPFTYYERYRMIRASLREVGMREDEFGVIPFPINRPELIRYYAPSGATFFITIYDDCGREKRRTLESLGLDVCVLWERAKPDRSASGSEVRRRILSGDAWSDMVPAPVFQQVSSIVQSDLKLRLGGT